MKEGERVTLVLADQWFISIIKNCFLKHLVGYDKIFKLVQLLTTLKLNESRGSSICDSIKLAIIWHLRWKYWTRINFEIHGLHPILASSNYVYFQNKSWRKQDQIEWPFYSARSAQDFRHFSESSTIVHLKTNFYLIVNVNCRWR